MAPSTPKKSERITLAQVADRAGVSTTTASLVLGGKADKHRISEETLQRVQQAADELDYAPNLLVRSMQQGQTQILSFYSAFRHRRANDLYMDRLSTAIENAAGRHGYNILVHCDFSLTPLETYRFLNGGHADGLLLFAPLPDDPLLPLLRETRLPVVLVNARDEAGRLPSVKDDVEAGMRQVADRLLELGHRRIAAFSEEGDEFRDAHERIDLLRRFLADAGVDLPERWVLRGVGDRTVPLRQLLSAPEPPTAIFCWRDHLAYLTLETCESMGLHVPEQLSVIGYDGLHWPAATRHTAASIHVDLDAVADTAIALLLRYIMGHAQGAIAQRVPVTLKDGTTLAPPYPDRTS